MIHRVLCAWMGACALALAIGHAFMGNWLTVLCALGFLWVAVNLGRMGRRERC